MRCTAHLQSRVLACISRPLVCAREIFAYISQHTLLATAYGSSGIHFCENIYLGCHCIVLFVCVRALDVRIALKWRQFRVSRLSARTVPDEGLHFCSAMPGHDTLLLQ